MSITSFLRGDLANDLRRKKQFIRWMMETDITEKELKNCCAAIDNLRDLSKVADIHNLGKATGWRRRLQLESVRIAGDLFEELEREGIQAYIYAGALIGYVRQGGFIPWDDDLDFCILRPDFNRLLKYFEEKNSLIYMDGDDYEENSRRIDEYCSKHKGEPLLIKYPGTAKYTIADNHVKRVTLDFFPYDFIKEGTDFEEYRNYVEEFINRSKKVSQKEKNIFKMENESKNPYSSMEPTSIIGSGLDCVPWGWMYERARRFIPSDYIFPLKKIEFEGRTFLCPAQPEKFLSEFKCPDYDSYPGTFARGGGYGHEEGFADWFARHGRKAEFVVHSEDEIKALLPLYEKLRDNNIFVDFINKIPGDSWGYTLDKYEVRYAPRRDFRSRWAVTMRDLEELGKYKNNKLLFTGDTDLVYKRMIGSIE